MTQVYPVPRGSFTVGLSHDTWHESYLYLGGHLRRSIPTGRYAMLHSPAACSHGTGTNFTPATGDQLLYLAYMRCNPGLQLTGRFRYIRGVLMHLELSSFITVLCKCLFVGSFSLAVLVVNLKWKHIGLSVVSAMALPALCTLRIGRFPSQFSSSDINQALTAACITTYAPFFDSRLESRSASHISAYGNSCSQVEEQLPKYRKQKPLQAVAQDASRQSATEKARYTIALDDQFCGFG